MDRSVDSIGSCSLDVDAESTDFSDTSGSLNLATPSSGKDIPREFTSRIKERCQITTQTQINYHCLQQQTSAILDPTSGKISTIVSPFCVVESPISSPVKKPSYLNLACCVNGYSNLTTYDSKLRQNINKSREVSPIRPSSNNSQQQSHRLSGNYLAVPLTNYGGSKSASSSPSAKGGTTMENRHSFTQVHGVDTTDNVGNGIYFKSSKFISSATLKGDIHENDTPKNTKSFIQQRVERLYGPGALAQGFYSPKKTKSQEMSILSERTANSQMKYSSSKTVTTFERDITTSSSIVNGKTTLTNSTSLERTSASHETSNENWENLQNGSGICDLPVLRHLRPEFRAQLPIMSPKRSPNKYPVNESSSCPVLQNGNSTLHINGTSNGNANLNLNGESHANDKQISGSEITVHFVAGAEKPKKPSNQINGTVNNNNIDNTRFPSEIIVPDPSCAIDKSLTDTKVILEKHTQESSECDKVTAVKTEQSTSITAEKTSEPVANVMTLEAEKTTSDSCVVHDIPKKPLGHILPLNNLSQTEQYSTENSSTDKMVQRDGNYFLQILKTEQERLLILASETEKELEALIAASASPSPTAVVSDDIFGYLRSASGKARLLVSQKMRQFEGLCKNNLNPLPDERFPTTNEDLQGFWDMVMLQVAHVDSLFHEIAMLRANNWQKPVQQVPSAPQGSKLIRRPNPTRSSAAAASTSTAANGTNAAKKSSASSLAAQRREAQRKQLMEIKRKNKMAMTSTSGGEQQPSENQVVEIFVNEQSNS